MRAIVTIIILNLLLIPIFWLVPASHRIHIYTIMAVFDGFLYLILTLCFFFRFYRSKPDAYPGLTLHFILLQIILLFSFFLFKLSNFLLLKHYI